MFFIWFIVLDGIPFLSGFYSKDLIIEMSIVSTFCKLLLVISTFLTAVYSTKVILFVFIKEPSASKPFMKKLMSLEQL